MGSVQIMFATMNGCIDEHMRSFIKQREEKGIRKYLRIKNEVDELDKNLRQEEWGLWLTSTFQNPVFVHKDQSSKYAFRKEYLNPMSENGLHRRYYKIVENDYPWDTEDKTCLRLQINKSFVEKMARENIIALLSLNGALKYISKNQMVSKYSKKYLVETMQKRGALRSGYIKSLVMSCKRGELVRLISKNKKLLACFKKETLLHGLSRYDLVSLFERERTLEIPVESRSDAKRVFKYLNGQGVLTKSFESELNEYTAKQLLEHFFRRINFYQKFCMAKHYIYGWFVFEQNTDSPGVHVHALIKGIDPLLSKYVEEELEKRFGYAKVFPYKRRKFKQTACRYMAWKILSPSTVDHYPRKIRVRELSKEEKGIKNEFDKLIVKAVKSVTDECFKQTPIKQITSVMGEETPDINWRMIPAVASRLKSMGFDLSTDSENVLNQRKNEDLIHQQFKELRIFQTNTNCYDSGLLSELS